MQELKKIEQRKKEREKKTLDLQKLITAADSNIEARRSERKVTKMKVVKTNVGLIRSSAHVWQVSGNFCLNPLTAK